MTYEVIQQDCLEYMRQQPDNIYDMILFSPPYNKKGLRNGVRTSTSLWSGANIDYGVYDDNMPEDEYQDWQIQIVNECYRLLKPNGSLFYQHKIRNWNRKGYHPMTWLSKSIAQFYQEIVWHRKNTPSIDCRYLYGMTERIYWFCKDKPNVYKHQVDEKFRSDVWYISPDTNNYHPAPFPEQLVENCILLTTQPDNIVFDPFAGSGTTLRVANRLNRKSIGTEIDINYVNMCNDNGFNELFELK
jgi:modification methylase